MKHEKHCRYLTFPHYFSGRFFFHATLFFLLVLLASCSTKKLLPSASYSGLSERKFYQTLESNLQQNYKTFEVSKFVANYSGSDQTKSFKGFIRLAPDSLLMVSVAPALGIEMVRLLFSKDTVGFIDRYNKSYFKERYTYFNSRFNLVLDKPILESVLTAQLPNTKNVSYVKHRFTENLNFYTLEYVSQNSEHTHKILYSFNKQLVLKRILLSTNSDVSYLTIDYKDYFDEVDMVGIPKTLIFTRYTSNSMDVMEIEYKNVNKNKLLNFPFTISNKYTKQQNL